MDLLKRQISESSMDIFSISESWLTGATPDGLVSLSNYSPYRLDRDWGGNQQGSPKKGGGLLTFIKKGINFQTPSTGT